MSQPRTVRPGRALGMGVLLFGVALALVLTLVTPAEGWRLGTTLGLSLGTAVALGAFRLKLRSFSGGGTAFMGALAGGFLLNIFFLAAGTILAKYTGWLGNHQGYAFGYLGAALVLGGLLTWHLRHGRSVGPPADDGPGDESTGGQDR